MKTLLKSSTIAIIIGFCFVCSFCTQEKQTDQPYDLVILDERTTLLDFEANSFACF
jgi:hypothetical protein